MKTFKQVFEEYAKEQPDYNGDEATLKQILDDPFFADLEIIAERFRNQKDETFRTGTESTSEQHPS